MPPTNCCPRISTEKKIQAIRERNDWLIDALLPHGMFGGSIYNIVEKLHNGTRAADLSDQEKAFIILVLTHDG